MRLIKIAVPIEQVNVISDASLARESVDLTSGELPVIAEELRLPEYLESKIQIKGQEEKKKEEPRKDEELSETDLEGNYKALLDKIRQVNKNK